MYFALWLSSALGAALAAPESWRLGAALAAINIAMVLLYAWDKLAAIRGRARIPERTLHICALLGASPGAFVAQRLVNHKRAKREFMRLFWLSVSLQIVLAAGIIYYTQIR